MKYVAKGMENQERSDEPGHGFICFFYVTL